MNLTHVARQAMEGHGEKGLQGARPLLGNQGDLLAAQDGLSRADEVHELPQRLHHHGPVALLLLQAAALSGSQVSQMIKPSGTNS